MDVERLRFLFGAEALEEIDDYDLDDESDRIELVERFAALPADAPERAGRMAVRTIAVTQILIDDPPETWRTAQRLSEAGLDRDAILSQLAMVIGEYVSAALSGTPFDTDAYVEALAALPLPTATDVAHRLVEVARAQQGIHADAHVDAVVVALSPTRTRAVVSMTNTVLDDLVSGPLHWLPGDATLHVPDLVDGRTFTHRVNDAEMKMGVLSVGFDLGAFAGFDSVRLDDGESDDGRSGEGIAVDQLSVEADHLGWRVADGWLDRFQPGDLLACTVVVHAPDGGVAEPIDATVTFAVIDDEPDVTDAVVGAVRAGYDELVAEPGLPVSGQELALWLLFHHRELFDDVLPPLDELCTAAGLERRGGRIAHDELVWRHDVLAQRRFRVNDMVPETRWQRVLGRAMEVLDDPDASVDEVREVLDECAEPETLDVLADVLFPHYLDAADEFESHGADAPGRLFDLVNRATAVARRPREIATAEYLACVLYERCADPNVAEDHLKRAVDAQPGLGPAVERLGWYRSDRGDARGAMRWWRTLTEMPDAAATVETFLARAAGARKLGRNDPCWCGSGRKFKQCHQNTNELPALPDRVRWLCRKASQWLEHATGDVRETVSELLAARASGDPVPDMSELAGVDDDELSELFRAAIADPIVFDAALHEGGLFALFLHERRALLPDDEQLLAASWLTVDRSVHEVVAVDPGVGMSLRNLATGDVVEVRERTASVVAAVGERYCARVVPDGASNQIVGGVFRVYAGQDEAVLDLCADGDGVELCAWVGALYQPPRLVHTPGLAESIIDRDAIGHLLADVDPDTDPERAMGLLGAELSRQAQAMWLTARVPALGGLTPREAAVDPTRREQLERLLAEFDSADHHARPEPDDPASGFVPIRYDVDALRHELGLD